MSDNFIYNSYGPLSKFQFFKYLYKASSKKKNGNQSVNDTEAHP